MKYTYINKTGPRHLRYLITAIVCFVSMLVSQPLQAQADSTQPEAAIADSTEEGSDLVSPSMEFYTIQKGDKTVTLNASLKAKVKGTFYVLPKMKISFVQVVNGEDQPLGFVLTDRNGKATLKVNADAVKMDAEGKIHFKALYAGNKQLEAAEEEAQVKRGIITMEPVKTDSLYTVQLQLADMGTGSPVPVPETVVGVYIDRSFSPLKLGEGTTDEQGEAAVEIPTNLSGDAKGNVTLMAKLEENETYGKLETALVQNWGSKTSDVYKKMQKSLWSPDPPLWMLITFIVLITLVWGHYVYIIVQLILLRKEEPGYPSNI